MFFWSQPKKKQHRPTIKGCGFKGFFFYFFTPKLGEKSQVDEDIFFEWVAITYRTRLILDQLYFLLLVLFVPSEKFPWSFP